MCGIGLVKVIFEVKMSISRSNTRNLFSTKINRYTCFHMFFKLVVV